MSKLTDAVREVVESRSTFVTESSTVVVSAGTLEVQTSLVLGDTNRKSGARIRHGSVGEAWTGFTVGIVVVTLGTGRTVLCSSECLLTLAHPIRWSAVARMFGIGTITG